MIYNIIHKKVFKNVYYYQNVQEQSVKYEFTLDEDTNKRKQAGFVLC